MKYCNRIASLFLAIILMADSGYAQHPSQVELEHQRGDHFNALLNFEKVPKRKVTAETRKTAAESAWALSLPQRALAEFDHTLSSAQLDIKTLESVRFSQAIIHLQEHRADQALVIGEKLAQELTEDSALKAKVQMLLGQCLIAMGLKAQAEEKFSLAFSSASYQERSEIAFQLGKLLSQLGRWDEAESYLKTIEIEDERAAESLRLLLEISFNNKNYRAARLYLDQISANFPEGLKDPWIFYVRSSLAIENSETDLLKQINSEAEAKLSPSDPWFNMLQADYELYQARNNKPKETL